MKILLGNFLVLIIEINTFLGITFAQSTTATELTTTRALIEFPSPTVNVENALICQKNCKKEAYQPCYEKKEYIEYGGEEYCEYEYALCYIDCQDVGYHYKKGARNVCNQERKECGDNISCYEKFYDCILDNNRFSHYNDNGPKIDNPYGEYFIVNGTEFSLTIEEDNHCDDKPMIECQGSETIDSDQNKYCDKFKKCSKGVSLDDLQDKCYTEWLNCQSFKNFYRCFYEIYNDCAYENYIALSSNTTVSTISKTTTTTTTTTTTSSSSFSSSTSITTTTTSNKSSTPTTKISKDGRCGKEYGTCKKGYCCSKYNWCGKSEKHCEVSQGCQSEFGQCNNNNSDSHSKSTKHTKTKKSSTKSKSKTKSTKKHTTTTKKSSSKSKSKTNKTKSKTHSTSSFRCGEDYGKCQKGYCCSKYGWCGKDSAYCDLDRGCQSKYGQCNNEHKDSDSHSKSNSSFRCGKDYGKCQKGYCCSKYGWCGKDSAYCDIDKGCQSKYGQCL